MNPYNKVHKTKVLSANLTHIMKIHIRTKNLEATPSLYAFISDKIGSLSKFLKHFEDQNVDELTLTLSRTTKHHHKGEVFQAKADLRLPGKVLRAVEEGEDIRIAIDAVKRKLHLEIEKYKTRLDPSKGRNRR